MKTFLPHIVHNVPIAQLIGHDGKLLPNVAHYVAQGVVRVIAGPEQAHCVINIRRPYVRLAAAPRMQGR